ncbi:MAG: hypothetical protein K6F74_08280 [Prevotella sp.]|nr:hypothetical protein [Prevotella sp.]MEE3445697.1 hypothetical protein [Prevotella sp.]
MNIKTIAIIALALLVPLSMQAQKKKKVIKRPIAVVPEEPAEDPRITEMRELTQQIIFFDSVVVEKNHFLSAIRLHPESGRLSSFNDFFRVQGTPDGYVYLNEMGNKCYFSDVSDDGGLRLFTSDKLGSEWSSPTPLKGISEGISEANYPFMMADGTTFYFAAKGEESIGGYDIFMTRYDAEDGRFFKPENIGMPFNSEANDYMYAIDETNNIGYFVTDRRQPEDKVCVYMFIPPTTRRNYNVESLSDEQLRGYADISRIADTWGNGKERKLALERLNSLQETGREENKPEMTFVINDQTTYTSVSQFRHPDSKGLYAELQEAKRQLEDTQVLLEKSRNYFAKASADDKQTLRPEILDAEKKLERLIADTKSLEKRIRNAENSIINP